MDHGNNEIMRTQVFVRAALALLVTATCLSFVSGGAFAADEKNLSEKLVDSFNALSGGPHAGYRANRTFFSVIDVLMRMGLVVGILSLGILALRAVVERRHIIGVLRALGYRRRSVMAGLMIESHINPDDAWSDAKQQVTPAMLAKIVEGLVVRSASSDDKAFKDTLGLLRDQIDHLDDDIMQKMANRMKISEKIGQYKKENNVTILQVQRWEEIIQTRVAMSKAMGLDEGFTRELLRLVHHESIQVQTKVMNQTQVKV